jgi:short-subunit dehydrogenase
MYALVTGASRGLGFEISKRLAAKGYDLILVANQLDRLEKVKEELVNAYANTIHVIACDLSKQENHNNLLESIQSITTSIDVLINNVGAFEMGGLEDLSIEQIDKLLTINFKSSVAITQHLLPQFKEKRSGAIINIGSIVTEVPRKDIAAYTISKFALKGYTKVLCDDLKDYNVKVTEVVPGSINTSSWDGIDAPKDEFIQTNDIVDAVEMVLNSSKGTNFEEIVIRPTNRNF